MNATIEKLLDRDSRMSYEELRRLAEDRLCYIRNLISLYHTYGHNKDQLERYVREMVQIRTIRQAHILDFEFHDMQLRDNDIVLSESESELSCLVYNDFGPSELRTLYDHSNLDSIYIRMNRAHQKLATLLAKEVSMDEEVLELHYPK